MITMYVCNVCIYVWNVRMYVCMYVCMCVDISEGEMSLCEQPRLLSDGDRTWTHHV